MRVRQRLSIAGALLLAAAALCGCATAPTTVQPVTAADSAFPLLAPASFGRSAQFEQVLHAAYGPQEATIQCVVTITPQRLSVLGLTALGQRVFTLEYDGIALTGERSSFAPPQVQPQRVLADIQFALWPLAALQAATAGGDWRVTEPRPGLRRLARGETLVAEVHRAGDDRLWLAQLRDGYTLDITTRETAP